MLHHVILTVLFFLSIGELVSQSNSNASLLSTQLIFASTKNPERIYQIDTSKRVYIECNVTNNSVVLERYRELSGKFIGFTDSTCIIQADYDATTTVFTDGEIRYFEYNSKIDSLNFRVDTLAFSDICVMHFDIDRKKHLIEFMQTTGYTFVLGFFSALILNLTTKNKLANSSGKYSLLTSLGGSIVIGGGSHFLHPKKLKLDSVVRIN